MLLLGHLCSTIGEKLHIIADLLLLGAIVIRNVTAIVDIRIAEHIESIEIAVLVKSHIIILVVVVAAHRIIVVVIHAAIR